MSYSIGGYIVVLGLLFFYGVQLVWRRKRLTQAAERVASFVDAGDGATRSGPGSGPGAGAGAGGR
jgi:hypothetical protein